MEAVVNPPASVVAVVVTYRREKELVRLLDGLAQSTVPLLGCIVVDHSPDNSLHDIAASQPLHIHLLENPDNPGPGAGWAAGAKEALSRFGSSMDAVWYLDDDVVIAPQILEVLLGAMKQASACAVAPLLEDASGNLWGFPEPLALKQRSTIRQARTPGDALRLLGPDPLPFCWATGACLLVKKESLQSVGFHRPDFWMLGEDLEYSMRLAAGGRAVFTCLAVVPHLPPPPVDRESARLSDLRKFRALLQNLSYLAFHCPHSAHMWRYLPGNFLRFFRTHGIRASTLAGAVACFWHGAVRSRPAGHPKCQLPR